MTISNCLEVGAITPTGENLRITREPWHCKRAEDRDRSKERSKPRRLPSACKVRYGQVHQPGGSWPRGANLQWHRGLLSRCGHQMLCAIDTGSPAGRFESLFEKLHDQELDPNSKVPDAQRL